MKQTTYSLETIDGSDGTSQSSAGTSQSSAATSQSSAGTSQSSAGTSQSSAGTILNASLSESEVPSHHPGCRPALQEQHQKWNPAPCYGRWNTGPLTKGGA